MACVEHDCTKCGWFGYDNSLIAFCPDCGSRASSFHDEDPDDSYGSDDCAEDDLDDCEDPDDV